MAGNFKESITVWDVVVVGGGPAGMMAAGRAAERGLAVLLLEKNATLGKKLLTTGGGRCNFTNNKSPLRGLLSAYKESADFLRSSFSQYNSRDAIRFFNSREVQTKEEADGRIFPVSNKARSVLDALARYMKEGRVTIKTNAAVDAIAKNSELNLFAIVLRNGKEYQARSCVIATGGVSRPLTGSTGDGFKWLQKLGHAIKKNNLALAPIVLKDKWVRALAGVSLEYIKLTVFLDGVKQRVEKGKLLFTHVGISGPAALHISKTVGELIPCGDTVIELDLFPTRDTGFIKRQLQEILIKESNKKIKNALSAIIPNALVSPVLYLAGIGENTPNHSVSHDERTRLSLLLKTIPLRCQKLLGADKAILSSGGVSLKEVDAKTLESRIVPRLYLVGDLLDIDRPSGGYSLQLCWTTGFVAGSHC